MRVFLWLRRVLKYFFGRYFLCNSDIVVALKIINETIFLYCEQNIFKNISYILKNLPSNDYVSASLTHSREEYLLFLRDQFFSNSDPEQQNL